MGDLAVLANGSPSRLSHVVGRAEQRGWVRRCTDPANGRVVVATLTDAGWEKVVASAPGHVEAVRRYVFDPLTRRRCDSCTTSCHSSAVPSTRTAARRSTDPDRGARPPGRCWWRGVGPGRGQKSPDRVPLLP